LLTALEHGGGRDVQLCSCDLVALSADVIVALGTALATDANLDAAVANSGRLEPMCSRWRPRTIPTLRSMFDAGERALASVIGALRVVEVVVPAEALVNVNTPEDLGRWRTSPSGPAALA
jgi:molybdopterin-guanine dinucleotide biosynthesis protein A